MSALSLDDGSITVSWLAPDADGGSDIAEYVVEWRADGEEFSDTERRLTTVDVSQQISDLTNGAEYWVRVRAVNAAGTGPAATVSGDSSHRPRRARRHQHHDVDRPGHAGVVGSARRRRRVLGHRLPECSGRVPARSTARPSA